MISGLHHIAIIVSSERSVEFYKGLGFKEIMRKERTTDTVVIMETSDGLRIELFVDPTHPSRATSPENNGLRYLSLKVDDIDSIANSNNSSPITNDWFGERYCIINDPDGLPVQLHE